MRQGGRDLLPVRRPSVGPRRTRRRPPPTPRRSPRTASRRPGSTEADLPFYATKQAIEDLEAVRDYLGVDKLQLYGESYGTQYVQTYAAAYPDRSRDPVPRRSGRPDRRRPDLLHRSDAQRRRTRSSRRSMRARPRPRARRTSAAATRSPSTTHSRPAQTGPDHLRLPARERDDRAAPARPRARSSTATFYYTYSRGARALLQRAIAAASHDNFVPLARLYYDA